MLYFDQGKGIRYRSLGCMPCTFPVESTAKNVEEVIEELEQELCGIKLERDDLRKKIQQVLKDSEFFGFEIDSLVDVILDTKGDQNKI